MRVALVVSLCAHAALLAIGFSAHVAPTPRPSELEVVLVNTRTETAPVRPKLLAQQQINGGGNADKGYTTTTLPHTVHKSANEVVLAALRQRQAQLEQQQRHLFTQLQSRQQTLLTQIRQDADDTGTDPGFDARHQQSLIINAQIGALKAAIDHYNEQPRQQFVAPSTKAVPYARYVEAWRKKIELIGTEHYPEQARGKVYGTLQMTVYIKKNGDLLKIQITRPSTHAILNSAAKRIVQLAAPFAPLPPSIAAHTDILAITRTWHFVNSRLTTITP
jgi:protein TonB